MLTRRRFGQLSALAALLPKSWPSTASVRRAVIVGIDEYVLAGPKPAASPGRRFTNLDGAVNDAVLMRQILQDRFGFLSANIVMLTNRQATRARILHEFQVHLIDAAVPGDLSFFYYAGHGSEVRNVASDEADQQDETLVPADANAGVPDIRDKEMARLYRAVLQKRVGLSVVLDSCHSGGMSRGQWNAAGKNRSLERSSTTVTDPPDINPATGQKFDDPAKMGMLFLAAARRDQPAGETIVSAPGAKGTQQDVAHGAFTAALSRVLTSPLANQSVEQICERVQAMLASDARPQAPVCGGVDRSVRGIVGQSAASMSAITVSAEAVSEDGSVRLRSGVALGLAPGCILSRISGRPVRLEVTRVQLATAEAKLLDGAAASSIQSGDIFKLDTWVTAPASALKVHFEKAGPEPAAVLAVARQLAALDGQNGMRLLTGISQQDAPTHVIFWKNAEYLLEPFPHNGSSKHLGASPSTEKVRSELAENQNVRLWVMLPADHQLASLIQLGAGSLNPGVTVVNDAAESLYLMIGRLHQDTIEYSWILKDALSLPADQLRLPIGTDWKTAAERLTDLALRLAKIYAWLNIDGPANGDSAFPYKLHLQRVGGPQGKPGSAFKFGERYKIVFEAYAAALKRAADSGGISKRYVYVFVIDPSGEASCLFPDPSNGNDQNLLPRGEPAPQKIEATRSEYDFEVGSPAGTDNYFLVTSEQPIDPGVFQWTGVLKPEKRGASSPLDLLFDSVGPGTRGVRVPRSVPLTWSIESQPIQSAAPN